VGEGNCATRIVKQRISGIRNDPGVEIRRLRVVGYPDAIFWLSRDDLIEIPDKPTITGRDIHGKTEIASGHSVRMTEAPLGERKTSLFPGIICRIDDLVSKILHGVRNQL